MDTEYQGRVFEYVPNADRGADHDPTPSPIIVVPPGPVGLTSAIDLAQQGVHTILLDDDDRLSVGSRAICFAKRTLEIFDRLGCGERMMAKGVSWNVGKVFFKDAEVYSFNLQAEDGHQHPAFINLQQYYVEGYLYERALELKHLDVRWRHQVVAITQREGYVELTIVTPDGQHKLRAAYVVAADGGRSAVRNLMGLESKGRVFRDRFLIADVKMTADFPSERWFWFDPPFHPNQSVLLHRQPDNVWRIDFQLGWDADPVGEKLAERVIPRVQALLGQDVEFELEWVSMYTFACLRMDDFRHGRVLFAGDAAHGVSPFGARGANSGVQDADNLAWKLKLVVEGKAPPALLDTYAHEREAAADENILNSTRATDFITPKSEVSRLFRSAVLSLAKDCPFARTLVNSGRLSLPSIYADSPLNTPDVAVFASRMRPGAPSADGPVTVDGKQGFFLSNLGNQFTGVYFSDGTFGQDTAAAMAQMDSGPLPVRPLIITPKGGAVAGPFLVIEDSEGLLAQRFDAVAGTYYLLRPDQHVCARWRSFESDQVREALLRAVCHDK